MRCRGVLDEDTPVNLNSNYTMTENVAFHRFDAPQSTLAPKALVYVTELRLRLLISDVVQTRSELVMGIAEPKNAALNRKIDAEARQSYW